MLHLEPVQEGLNEHDENSFELRRKFSRMVLLMSFMLEGVNVSVAQDDSSEISLLSVSF